MEEDSVEIKDVYFRRFFVPLVIALLIIAGAACIIADSPGSPANWETGNTVFGAQVAGAWPAGALSAGAWPAGAWKKLVKGRR
jgi:hypothetical protein